MIDWLIAGGAQPEVLEAARSDAAPSMALLLNHGITTECDAHGYTPSRSPLDWLLQGHPAACGLRRRP